MSQPNRKHKRLEALFSETAPAQPDPATPPSDSEVNSLKTRVAELEAKLSQQSNLAEPTTTKTGEPDVLPLIAQPEPEAPQSGWSSRVADKGIFARIRRPFDRLSYPRKFVFVSILFLLPLLVFYPLVREQIKQIENYGYQESRGVEYLDTLDHVLNLVQSYYLKANGYYYGQTSLTDIKAAELEVDDAFANLTKVQAENAAALGLADEPAQLVGQWQKIKSSVASHKPIDALESQLVADIQAFIFKVGNNSNLILDPDLDTYYIMDAALQKIPENQVLLSQILKLSYEVVRTQSVTPEQSTQFTELVGRYKKNLEALNTNVVVALENNKSGQMRPLIGTDLTIYTETSLQFLSTLAQQVANASASNGDTTTIMNGGRQVMVLQETLFASASNALQSGIQARIRALSNRLIFGFSFALITAIVAFVLGLSVMRAISVPLQSLTSAAEQLAGGDMTARAKVLTGDEVGQTAAAFNVMADRLRQTLTMLTDRTHDLTLASEVSQQISEMNDIGRLLTSATELIRQRFNLYYVQVYLLDNSNRNLILRAGTGEVGQELMRRGFQLPVNAASLNGTAVIEERAVIISDTARTINFRPNPLLPDTRSEMCIPLVAGDQPLGVLDLQSERPGTFSEENLPVFNTLVGQLSIALQNAALFAQAQEARMDLEAQIGGITQQGWREFLNAVDRGQRLGYSFDQAQVVPLNAESLEPVPADTALSVPLQSTGVELGVIQVINDPDYVWQDRDVEVAQAVAARLSQHIDNLRLLAQAEYYRDEAEQAVRRLTREGWDAYLQQQGPETSAFEYDLNAVLPLTESGNGHQPSGVTQPLAVRDEVIGEFSVHVDEDPSGDAAEIVSVVAAQLSSHIDNLRLSLSNMKLLKSTEERAQREQILRQLTTALRSSTNPSTIMRTAVRELGSILGRKAVVQVAATEPGKQPESTMSGNGSDSSPSQPQRA